MNRILSLILATLVIALSSVSSANDWKVTPASWCNWDPGASLTAPATGSTIVAPYFVNTDGSIGTTTAQLAQYATSAVSFECPVLRDYTTNTNGLIDFRVNVFDASTTAMVQCRLTSMSADDTQRVVYGPIQSGTTFASGYTQLRFTGVNTSWSGGYYSLDCYIGENTKILSYMSVEPSGGDST